MPRAPASSDIRRSSRLGGDGSSQIVPSRHPRLWGARARSHSELLSDEGRSSIGRRASLLGAAARPGVVPAAGCPSPASKGRKRGGGPSQSRGGYHSEPGTSDCHRSKHQLVPKNAELRKRRPLKGGGLGGKGTSHKGRVKTSPAIEGGRVAFAEDEHAARGTEF